MAEERKEMQSEQKQTTQVNGSAGTKKRRSAISIMGSLIGLVKPLIHIMLAAIVLGSCRTGHRAWTSDRRGRHECSGGKHVVGIYSGKNDSDRNGSNCGIAWFASLCGAVL